MSSQSKPARVPSEVHRGEQDFAGAALLGFARPLDDAAPGGFAAALHIDLRHRAPDRRLGSRRASIATTTACAPKLRPMALDERGIGERGGVDADLVGAGLEDLLRRRAPCECRRRRRRERRARARCVARCRAEFAGPRASR